jgi:two-component system sensor histidine kinase/response regulator
MKFRICLTEDSPVQTMRVKKILAALPEVELTCFDDGLKAYLYVLKSPPDLLLLDLILPGLHGLAVCRLLKFHESRRAMPIIVFSSITDGDLGEQANAAGANGFLRKPFLGEELLAQIRAFLPLAANAV